MTAPATVPPLGLIRAALISLIPAQMKKSNGYYFDWGSVNVYEPTLCTFPRSILHIEGEKPTEDYRSGGINAQQYENVARLTWLAQGEAPAGTDGVISYDAEDALDKLDHDIKKFFGVYYSYGAWSEVYYQGHDRKRDADPKRPGWLESAWDIRYAQSQRFPHLAE